LEPPELNLTPIAGNSTPTAARPKNLPATCVVPPRRSRTIKPGHPGVLEVTPAHGLADANADVDGADTRNGGRSGRGRAGRRAGAELGLLEEEGARDGHAIDDEIGGRRCAEIRPTRQVER
jgi:hypothetical protein